jgi:hypothetical protein
VPAKRALETNKRGVRRIFMRAKKAEAVAVVATK